MSADLAPPPSPHGPHDAADTGLDPGPDDPIDAPSPFAPSPVREYADFLDELAELGLLDGLEEQLPAGFSAVYEIGRVLADPSTGLAARLAPMMRLAPGGETPLEAAETEPDSRFIEVPAGEEYEAEFIRSWSDVRYLYSWQWLLPEEAFLRRLAERTLWFPMAKAPRIHAIDAGEDDFAPSPSKQKVYVLLDTSRSMVLRHRFALAKAAVIRFLRENRRELGEVFLRRFDVDVGRLHVARDRRGFDRLIRHIARQGSLGNGTCLEKAILTACEDIREQRTLASAEILIVTDGAAQISIGRVREALGKSIRLHCLKLGHAQVYPTDQWIQDRLETENDVSTRRGQRIVQLRDRKEQLETGLRNATDGGTRSGIERELGKVAAEQSEIARELRADFGHEIEQLAHLYLELDDLDAAEVFRLDDARLEALKDLVRRVLEELDASPAPAEIMKQAALLMSHIAMLAGEQSDPIAREFLDQLRGALEKRPERPLQEHEEHIQDRGLNSPAPACSDAGDPWP